MKEKKDDGFRFIDLCCGIGAFHMAMKRLGGRCVLACDKNEDSRATYEANHGTQQAWHEDIFTIEKLPPHEVLCAGFPCTTFSFAGNRRGTGDDDAGQIIFAILRLIDVSRPKVVLLENVTGLLSIHGGQTLKFIRETLEKMGYNVDIKAYDAANFGSPMHRTRLLIFCTQAGPVPISIEMPKSGNKSLKNVRDFLEPLTPDEISKQIVDRDRYVLVPEASRYYVNKKLFVGYMTKIHYKPGINVNQISAHAQSLVVYGADGFCENFTATHRFPFLIDSIVRYLTPREMYSMMGFPRNFKLSTGSPALQIRQLSNSINLFMLRALLKKSSTSDTAAQQQKQK
jgi:DNA (cytosine-5)-methyltransferase 1